MYELHVNSPESKDAYQDRKSVVQGKSVDLGGRRIIKKKKSKDGRKQAGAIYNKILSNDSTALSKDSTALTNAAREDLRLKGGAIFFFSSRRRHTRLQGDWSSDVCSSDLWTKVCHLTWYV